MKAENNSEELKILKQNKEKLRLKKHDIRIERNRLNRVFKNIPEDVKKTVAGLIDNAAWMRIQLKEYQADLELNGFTEKFTQSVNTPAYDRERVVSKKYTADAKNYMTMIKQLVALLPKDKPITEEDEFNTFVHGRG